MSGKRICLLVMAVMVLILLGGCTGNREQEKPIGMAVEFMDHAACAYIARHKNWFQEEGLEISAYASYVTGMSLSSALAQGDIQVAYICLVPAINAYANAGVPIKIVAGTHKHGYSLVVNPQKIQTVDDLEKAGMRIGCVREGGSVDVLFRRLIEKHGLDRDAVLENMQRMNPPKQIIAVRTGRLDAAFLPEHHATVAEEYGFKTFRQSKDVWPQMQGSVLAVRQKLIEAHPDTVRKLVRVTQKATAWAKQNKGAAADIVAENLQAIKGEIFPAKVTAAVAEEKVNSKIMYRSMWEGGRLKYTTAIDPVVVQDIIGYLADLGYIREEFSASDILDLRFLEE